MADVELENVEGRVADSAASFSTAASPFSLTLSGTT